MTLRTSSLCVAIALAIGLATPTGALGTEQSDPAETTAPTGSSAIPPTTFEMRQPKDRWIGDWHKIGIADVDAPSHLTVVDDTLVAIGRACGPKPLRCRPVGWYSFDAGTWTEAPIPGDHPVVLDLATTPDGSMAVLVGEVSDHETYDAGAVWSTTDGVEWTQVGAPPVRSIDWVAASGEAVVVSGGGALWVSPDLETWQQVSGPGGLPIAFGPGGFLAFGGGGQDLVSATELWRSEDGSVWSGVTLPRALRRGPDAFGGIQVFAHADGWILVPDEAKLPGDIYTSPNGRRWRRAPRPRGMAVGYVWWIEALGREVQAFGWMPDLPGQPSGIWTWRPGRKARTSEAWTKTGLGQPVTWNGRWVALGASNDSRGTSFWRWEPQTEAAVIAAQD